jgi:putative salt-induced outer membrane protein YdiY
MTKFSERVHGCRSVLAEASRRTALLVTVLLTSVLSLAAPPTPAVAQDFVLHANGDSINGEVKGMGRGKLKFEIPGSGSFQIDWIQVRAVGTQDVYEVEVESGERFFGTLAPGPELGTLMVRGDTGEVVLSMPEIVGMTSIEGKFWSRFDGLVEFGFSFAKANSAVNYSLEAQINYRAHHDIVSLGASSFLQSQEDAETTKRNRLNLTYNRLLPGRWLLGGIAQTEQNQQLDLDLRASFGAGGGRDLIQSNAVMWNLFAGAMFNRERYVDLEATNTFEGLLGSTFEWFTFAADETDLVANLLVLPSFTQSGRWRIDFDIKFRQELFGDFYLSISFYDQFDSKPPTDGNKNDFGTTLALGWDF